VNVIAHNGRDPGPPLRRPGRRVGGWPAPAQDVRGDIHGVYALTGALDGGVAVRHADDHVHVVATLARQDGRRVFPRNDFFRAGEACREVEAKYGLTVTAASDRTAAKRPTYAETQQAARRGYPEPVRDTLRRSVRTAAAGAVSLGEFLERLRDDGLLVRERMSERNPGEITGYAVALPDAVDPGGQPIHYGGGKLAADLTLPKLRRRWDIATPDGDASQASDADRKTAGGRWSAGTSSTSTTAEGSEAGNQQHRPTAEERARIWEQATAAAARASEQVRAAASADPRAAADAAWAASDFLAAAARVIEGRSGGPLTAAAGEYDRAGRELWGRVPPPSRAGQGCAPRRCCSPPHGSSAATRAGSCSPCSPSWPHLPTPSPGFGKAKTGRPKPPRHAEPRKGSGSSALKKPARQRPGRPVPGPPDRRSAAPGRGRPKPQTARAADPAGKSRSRRGSSVYRAGRLCFAEHPGAG